MNLIQDEIKKHLEKYNFLCDVCSNDDINVTCPNYRLDVIKEVDLIEEVARIHGYDNIEPKMPQIQLKYTENRVWSNMDKLRNLLKGLNFNEVINYSFIPSNSMKILSIDENNRLYSDINLKNPISPSYSLMRPTMVYSMVNCLAYNYSRNNTDLALFEIGRTYFKNLSNDTNCEEVDTVGIIMSGNRINRGWNVDKDVKYTYYDLLNYLNVMLSEFNQSFCLEKADYPFFEDGTGLDIKSNGNVIGFLGEIKKSVSTKIPNAKLIKSKMFYCEIYLKHLYDTPKTIQFESKYPPIKRSYNFIYNKNICSKSIVDIIKKSSDIVKTVEITDLYEKSMSEDQCAVLFEVTYCSNTETLNSEQIETIEKQFLSSLEKELNVKLKY